MWRKNAEVVSASNVGRESRISFGHGRSHSSAFTFGSNCVGADQHTMEPAAKRAKVEVLPGAKGPPADFGPLWQMEYWTYVQWKADQRWELQRFFEDGLEEMELRRVVWRSLGPE